MTKLTVGSYAMILDANEVRENIGKQVLLLGLVPAGEKVELKLSCGTYGFDGGPRGVWVVQSPGLLRNDINKGKVADSIAAIEPCHLLPIPGVLGHTRGIQPRTKSA